MSKLALNLFGVYKVTNTKNNFWFIGEFLGLNFQSQCYLFATNKYQKDGFHVSDAKHYTIEEIKP